VGVGGGATTFLVLCTNLADFSGSKQIEGVNEGLVDISSSTTVKTLIHRMDMFRVLSNEPKGTTAVAWAAVNLGNSPSL